LPFFATLDQGFESVASYHYSPGLPRLFRSGAGGIHAVTGCIALTQPRRIAGPILHIEPHQFIVLT
jgi:hypothetical protein